MSIMDELYLELSTLVSVKTPKELKLEKEIHDLGKKLESLEEFMWGHHLFLAQAQKENSSATWRASINGTYYYVDKSRRIRVFQDTRCELDNMRYKSCNYFISFNIAETWLKVTPKKG